MKMKDCFEFEIEITGREHQTWQGFLRTSDSIFKFDSALELLLKLDSMPEMQRNTFRYEKIQDRQCPEEFSVLFQ